MRYALVLLLAGPALAGDLAAARAAMDALIKEGDELRAKGDLDGALAKYRKAVSIFKDLAKEDGKAPEGKEVLEPAPTDDGTAEGRKRVVAYYMKMLRHADDEVRYKAVATLGEMRAAEARDALVEVLAKDKYQVARRAAAWSLGRLGKEGAPAIPALVREVGGEFPLLGYMCDKAISDITEAMGARVTMGYETEMTPEGRAEVQKKWVEWLNQNRERLGIPPPPEEPAEGGK